MNKTIGDLSGISTVGDSDLVAVQSGNTTYSATISQVADKVTESNSGKSYTLSPQDTIDYSQIFAIANNTTYRALADLFIINSMNTITWDEDAKIPTGAAAFNVFPLTYINGSAISNPGLAAQFAACAMWAFRGSSDNCYQYSIKKIFIPEGTEFTTNTLGKLGSNALYCAPASQSYKEGTDVQYTGTITVTGAQDVDLYSDDQLRVYLNISDVRHFRINAYNENDSNSLYLRVENLNISYTFKHNTSGALTTKTYKICAKNNTIEAKKLSRLIYKYVSSSYTLTSITITKLDMTYSSAPTLADYLEEVTE